MKKLITALILCVSACVNVCMGEEYPLKLIAKAISEQSEPKIANVSKKLLESTRGIVNYQAKIPKALQQKLESRQNLSIRVLGDSHIAGDFFSHRLRGLLFKDYTLGFVYPLYPNYHQNIALKYESENFEILNSRIDELDEYPLGGVVAKPIELPASITLSPQKSKNPIETKIIFKSPNKESALIVEDSNNQRFIINAKRPFVWQFLSLSLYYPATIRALNEKVLLGGFFLTDEKNNIVENLGINGARSNLWLKWDKALFIQQMRFLPVDLVILCYGSNDALYDTFNESLFVKNYSDLIDSIREANPNASILLLTPPPVVQKVSNASRRKKAVYKMSKNAKSVREAVIKVAKQKQTMLFDLEGFINQSGGKKKWEEAALAKADVHLLPNGYKLVADKIFYELQKIKSF